ncbi:threonine aldolase family protein [Lacibacter sp. H407]|uniref:threonine aldolase family protein n=1 Tax=Lacibacter sp. H407 TaxID=3133423 RepID=UPI0030C35BB9
MSSVNRRNFLKASGTVMLPALVPAIATASPASNNKTVHADESIIKFFYDGEFFSPAMYIEELQKINSKQSIERDVYGQGGAVTALEKKFASITGKAKAIFLPSGTMANQLAIAVLSGNNTKVFVQDESHVYRDEADAAQSVFQKRLMPLAKGKTYFTAAELTSAVEALQEEEVFPSGIGAVSIENPVRRMNGRMIPLDEIKKISAYCKSKQLKLHLDGARLYMASAWSGVTIKEYASFFDTIYISLYKYLGAAGGAILCGDASVIDQIPHLVKIHGGSIFGNWTNAAMVLHRMEGLETRLQESVKQANHLFTTLNKTKLITVTALEAGTNIYPVQFSNEVNGKRVKELLDKQYNIKIPQPNENNQTQFTVNETILYRDIAYIRNAFLETMNAAKS